MHFSSVCVPLINIILPAEMSSVVPDIMTDSVPRSALFPCLVHGPWSEKGRSGAALPLCLSATQTDRHDGQRDRQTDRQRSGQSDRETARHKNSQRDSQLERQPETDSAERQRQSARHRNSHCRDSRQPETDCLLCLLGGGVCVAFPSDRFRVRS